MTPFEKLANSTVVINQIIWIPAALAGGEDGVPAPMKTFFDDFPCVENHQIVKAIPALAPYTNPDMPVETIPEHLVGVEGYFFQVETPQFNLFGANQYSWGASYQDWLYAKTTDEMIDLAVAWADERHKHDQQKEAA